MEKLHNPRELSHEELASCLEKVQDLLWPNGDRDHEWGSETIDGVADALIEAGIGPDYTR